MFHSVSEVLPAVQIIAGLATGLGFFFTYLTFQRIRKTEQIKLAEKINESLVALDKERYQIDDDDEEAISFLNWRRLNTLEWYAFLVFEKQIISKRIQEYFEDAVIYNWENYATDEQKSDPTLYAELRKLYEKVKAKRQQTSRT